MRGIRVSQLTPKDDETEQRERLQRKMDMLFGPKQPEPTAEPQQLSDMEKIVLGTPVGTQEQTEVGGRKMREGWLPYLGAAGTRIAGGVASSMGMAPGAIISTAAEGLAQRIESPDPMDERLLAIEGALGAIPGGKIIKALGKGASIGKTALGNALRTAGVIEAGNLARRAYAGKELGDWVPGNPLPTSPEEALFDLATMGIGGGVAGGLSLRRPVGQATSDEMDKLGEMLDQTPGISATAEPTLIKAKTGAKRSPTGEVPLSQSKIAPDTTTPALVAKAKEPKRPALRVGALPQDPVEYAQTVNARSVDNAPLPLEVKLQIDEINARPSRVPREWLDSQGKPITPEAEKALAHEDAVKELARRRVMDRFYAAQETKPAAKMAKAEDAAERENLRNRAGGTDVGKVKVGEAKAQAAAGKEIVEKEKAHTTAAKMREDEERLRRAEEAIEYARREHDLVPDPPVVTETTVSVPTTAGKESLKTTYRPRKTDDLTDEDLANAVPAAPRGPLPVVPKNQKIQIPKTDPDTVAKTKYTSHEKAKTDLAGSGKRGQVTGMPRNWRVVFDDAAEAPKVAPKAEAPVATPAPEAPVPAAPAAYKGPERRQPTRIQTAVEDAKYAGLRQRELEENMKARGKTVTMADQEAVKADTTELNKGVNEKFRVTPETATRTKQAPPRAAKPAPAAKAPQKPVEATKAPAKAVDTPAPVEAPTAAPKPSGEASSFKVGDTVNYKGNRATVADANDPTRIKIQVEGEEGLRIVKPAILDKIEAKPAEAPAAPVAAKPTPASKPASDRSDYKTVRAAAQKQANETGRPVGLEKTTEYGKEVFNIKSIPADPKKRFGYEARIEVVDPEVAPKTSSGRVQAKPAQKKMSKAQVDALTREDIAKMQPQELVDLKAAWPKDKRLQSILADEYKARDAARKARIERGTPPEVGKRIEAEQAAKDAAEAKPTAPTVIKETSDGKFQIIQRPQDNQYQVRDTSRKGVLAQYEDIADAQKHFDALEAKATPAKPTKVEGEPTAPVKTAEQAEPTPKAADEVAEALSEQNRRVGRKYVWDDKDNIAKEIKALEDAGWTAVRKEGDSNGKPILTGVPPKRKYVPAPTETDVDVSKAKDGKGVKTAMVSALKKELGTAERTVEVTAEGNTILVNGKPVGVVHRGRGADSTASLRMNEEIEAAANKGEIPTIIGNGTKADAIEEAVGEVRGWALKQEGVPSVTIKLPNGFGITVARDPDAIQAAIRKIEKGGDDVWNGIVDAKKVPQAGTESLEWPWGKPGSKSKYTAEEVSGDAFSNQSEVIENLKAFVQKLKYATDTPTEPLKIKLDNGFEMTVPPHPEHAAMLLEKLEKQPMSVWATKAERPTHTTVPTRYGTSFTAKGDGGDAPAVKMPIAPIAKKAAEKPEPPTKPSGPSGEGAKPAKKGVRVAGSPLPEGVANAKAKIEAETGKPLQEAAAEAKQRLTGGKNLRQILDEQKAARQVVEAKPTEGTGKLADLALQEKQAWDDYFDIKKQAKDGIYTDADVRAAGKAAGELRAQVAAAVRDAQAKGEPIPTFLQKVADDQAAKAAAAPKAKVPAGKGPTSDDLAKMPPAEQEATIKKTVEEFKKRFGRKMTDDEKGAAVTELATRLGLGVAGAVAGSMTMDDPIMGALLGGIVGVGSPAMFRTLYRYKNGLQGPAREQAEKALGERVKEAASGFLHILPDYYRGSYLARFPNLPINAWAGPYGAATMGAIEAAATGDKRGFKALNLLYNPKNFFFKNVPDYFGDSMKEARLRVTDSMERGDIADAQALGQGLKKEIITFPAVTMTAGDIAARKILMKAGFSEPEARALTLTSEPLSGLAGSIGAFRKYKGGKGFVSPIAKLMLPFYRTAINQIEQSALRTPAGNILRSHWNKAPVETKTLLIQSGITTAVGIGAFQAGANTDPLAAPVMLKFINNFAGPYGAGASAMFLAGVASQKGDNWVASMPKGALQYITTGLPLPTADIVTDWFKAVESLVSKGEVNLPYGTIPPIISSKVGSIEDPFGNKVPMSIPTAVRGMTGDPEWHRPTKQEYGPLPFLVTDKPKLAPKPKSEYERKLDRLRQERAAQRKAMREAGQ